MIYLSIDIETTGLNRSLHDIIEFGAVFDDLKNQKPIEELPKFHCYFLPPENGCFTGSPFALSMHTEIFKKIASHMEGGKKAKSKNNVYPPMSFGKHFKRFLIEECGYEDANPVRINVAGKNFGSFDLPFLLEKTDIRKHVGISHKIIDPAFMLVKKDDTSLPSSYDCSSRIGEDPFVDHTAVEDSISVIKMVRYCWNNVLKY
jgi:oligoribonuclease